MEKNTNRNNSGISESNSSNAMNSKPEVEQSNVTKTDQDFPGYPHYPAKEDIMNQRKDSRRVDMDVENLPSAHNATGVSQRFITAQESKKTGDETIHDEQDDELAMLNSKNEEIGSPQNISNEDLGNIPGTDSDEETNER